MSRNPETERTVDVLPCAPESVSAARRRADAVVAAVASATQRRNLRLVVSEVVSNAVKYGAPGEDVTFAMTPKDGYVCVQVTDNGPGLAARPGAIDDNDGGFGLPLVEKLTRRWGVTREAGRTRVWFELDFA